jgi:hypothetical protein
MDKLLPLLALIVMASISVGPSAAGEPRFAGPPSHPFATDAAEGDAAVVLVGGMGGGATTGGMGGGATTGGMGGGATTGGMGGGAMTGGMGGGATTGGMGGGATTGGMGGGATTGGMGGGATTGGMGGGAATGGMGSGAPTGGMFGGGMFNNPPPSFGTNSGSGWPGDNAQPSYYTYQCVTSSGQCSFVAPASLRARSLRVGARCSCSDGQSQGQVR